MKAAAIYARVSTEEQVKNTSLKGQLDACRQHAIQQGYTVIREVAEDFSGVRLDRPGLGELRDMARSGDIQALVVYEADRLSRKLGHLLLLQEELDRAGAELVFVNSQDDTTSPEGRMFFQMRGAFGEYEKSKITERFRLGKMRLARQGKVIGNSFQPLGYQFVAGEYIVIEDEARIVRQIFEWVALDRLSIRQICLKLTQMGAHTKRGNTHWGPPSVKGILDNPAYTGTACWNRHEAIEPKQKRLDGGPRKYEKTSKRIRDAAEWVRVPCPPIVSEDLWEAAHKQLQVNKHNSLRNTKRAYLLRGLMKCGLCGYRYYGRGTRGFHYYYCGGENLKDPCKGAYTGQKCPSKSLRADRIEARVWDYIQEQITDEEKLLATFELRGAGIEEELRRDQAELEAVYAAEGRVSTDRNKMLDLYTEDRITKDVLQERLSAIQKRAESLSQTKTEILERIERRKSATATTEALKEYCRLVREGSKRAASNPQSIDYRREFLEILETQVLIDSERIHISGIINGVLPLFDAEPRLLCSNHEHRLSGVDEVVPPAAGGDSEVDYTFGVGEVAALNV